MRSLFILSLPRSLSSHVYAVSRAVLGIEEPAWTTSGEILNLDRHVLYRGPAEDESLKYATPGRSPEVFRKASVFLDQTLQPRGFAYKDVVQPWIAAQRAARGDLAVLKIVPDVAHTAFAMLANQWHYPRQAACEEKDLEGQVIEGLLRAARILGEAPGESVAFEDLLWSEEPLATALRRLYPDRELPSAVWVRGEFARRRDERLRRRDSPAYRKLARRVEEMKAGIA